MGYPGPGFIREEQDVMYLILYALRFFPFPITESDLMDVVLIDDGFSYFEFRSAFCRLLEGGFILSKPGEDDLTYSLAPSGVQTIQVLASSLPLSVRDKAERAALQAIAKIRRESAVKTSHQKNPDGTFTVQLRICDQTADHLKVEILAMTKRQCDLLEDTFRRQAKPLYHDLLLLLSGGREME